MPGTAAAMGRAMPLSPSARPIRSISARTRQRAPLLASAVDPTRHQSGGALTSNSDSSFDEATPSADPLAGWLNTVTMHGDNPEKARGYAEVAYLTGRTRVVNSHFPTALGVDDFLHRLEIALYAYGFNGDNSIGEGILAFFNEMQPFIGIFYFTNSNLKLTVIPSDSHPSYV